GRRIDFLTPTASTELRHPPVFDTVLDKPLGHGVRTELRAAPGPRVGAHIDEHLDLVLAQQLEEIGYRQGPVPDRPDLAAFAHAVTRSVDPMERRRLVHGDVVGLVALDLVL